MSRPPTRGADDASSPREARLANNHERPKRPTRNAPRIFPHDTILYANNSRPISQTYEQDDGATEEVHRTSSATPQTPTSTAHNSPERRTRKHRTIRVQSQASATAPIMSQLRQGRINQTKGLQQAVDRIITLMKEQDELAEKRYSELRAELQEARAQNEHLKQELRECKEEIQGCREALQQGASNRLTYAAAAAGTRDPLQPTYQTPGIPDGSSGTLMSLPGFDLDMTEAYGIHMENASVKRIRERIQQAFKSHGPTQDIGWVGIARRGGNLARVRVCLRTHEDERKARIHTDWITTHFNGARIHGEQWHVVKVDRVNKNAICDNTRIRIQEDACERLSAENGVTIRKMHFLGQQSPDKLYCSIAIYLTSHEEAESLLHRKFVEVDGELAYTKPYARMATPQRCYNCQAFDKHKAHRCPALEPTCGVCARTGHTNRECTAGEPKCANCEGPHRASDRGCPVYKRLRSELNPISNA